MTEVYVGVLSQHDIFQYEGRDFVIVDDCFYLKGACVIALCFSHFEALSSARCLPVFLFPSSTRVLVGGESCAD